MLVDRYMQGTEVEVDAVSDGTTLIPALWSILNGLVYTPATVSPSIRRSPVGGDPQHRRRLHGADGPALKVKWHHQCPVRGARKQAFYAISLNPRSSRTVPVLKGEGHQGADDQFGNPGRYAKSLFKSAIRQLRNPSSTLR